MASDSFLITLDGEEATDLYEDVVSLDVELSDDLPASFRIVLGTAKEGDGSWRYLDEERFRPWTPVTVEAGFVGGGREEVLAGYVTAVAPTFAPAAARSTIEITGLDASVAMDREERLAAWPNKKDSDIARELFQLHGFTPDVEGTAVVHDEALSTVIQRETDWQFVRRLARRNGFACWVEGATGHFRPLPADPEPQPVLAAHFGGETTLRRFALTVDALRPAEVAMFQVDRFGKEVLAAEAATGPEDALGALTGPALLGPGVPAGRVVVAKNAATGRPEMEALCRGLAREGAWLVSGEGEVDAAAYGHVLRPRGLVTVKGVGETHSGVYYVSFARHTFTREGYTQRFRVRRDGLLPTGGEAFASGDGLGLA
jgi:phage protein D